jgi:hypothetical protein
LVHVLLLWYQPGRNFFEPNTLERLVPHIHQLFKLIRADAFIWQTYVPAFHSTLILAPWR